MTSEGLEREREAATVWAEERKSGMIDTKSDLGMKIWLPGASYAGV